MPTTSIQHLFIFVRIRKPVISLETNRCIPRLETRLPWQDPSDTKYRSDGKAIPRRTIFSVSKGCNCTYKYSGVAVKPYVEPDWLAEIREKCVDMAGLDEQPNSCNINLYRDGNDQVGWHADDEPLFEGEYNDVCILSLSLGSSRTFQVKKKGVKGVGRNEATSSFVVSHGDLCTMEGRFQRHYLHAVLREPDVQEPRINLTWRFITKHNEEDGCPLHGPGNWFPVSTPFSSRKAERPGVLMPTCGWKRSFSATV